MHYFNQTHISFSGASGCGDGLWECDDGDCINVDWLCDRILDCRDESDESESQCDGSEYS